MTLYTLFNQMIMESSKDKILEYEKRALESIPTDHPHKEEIKKLLIDQVNDDLSDATNSLTNRRAS